MSEQKKRIDKLIKEANKYNKDVAFELDCLVESNDRLYYRLYKTGTKLKEAIALLMELQSLQNEAYFKKIGEFVNEEFLNRTVDTEIINALADKFYEELK